MSCGLQSFWLAGALNGLFVILGKKDVLNARHREKRYGIS